MLITHKLGSKRLKKIGKSERIEELRFASMKSILYSVLFLSLVSLL